MSLATPLSNGLQPLSLLTALKLALKSILPTSTSTTSGSSASLKATPLAEIYGAPISLPFTSNPKQEVVKQFVEEYLNALYELEAKYSSLHRDH
jgi:hypothetical protein